MYAYNKIFIKNDLINFQVRNIIYFLINCDHRLIKKNHLILHLLFVDK